MGRLPAPLAIGLLALALLARPAQAQLDYGRSFNVTVEPAKVGLGDSVTVRFRFAPIIAA